MRETFDEKSGTRTLTLCDREAWWDDELRLNIHQDGTQTLEITTRNEGRVERTQDFIIPEDVAAALGAWILENSRPRARETA